MAKPVGKTSVVKTLIGNRAVRKVVIRNAKHAVTYATTTIAARKAAGSGDAGPAPESSAAPSGKPAAKPASAAFDSVAVTSFVTSVVKPVAEKMATTQTGRSVLQTLNNISGDALGTTPKRSDNPLNAFVAKLAGAAASARTDARPAQPEKATVKFTPLQPVAAQDTEPVKTVKWPPPKLPEDSVTTNRSGTGSAPE